jgi:flagellar motor switch protein FliN/FliY
VTTEQALLRVAAATTEAVLDVLGTLAPDGITPGSTRVVTEDGPALTGVELPGVLTELAFVDGVEGGNVLVVPLGGARRLAAAMMGQPTEDASDEPLDEMELSAVSEAMNQMMSAAAAATGAVIGQDVEIAPPEARVVTTPDELTAASVVESGHATVATFKLFGIECRLMQLVPPAFIVHLEDALGSSPIVGPEGTGDALRDAMLDIDVRVWAELGRTRMPSLRAVGLPAGSVVELDREAEDPIDVYVDGLRFATGRLVVTDEGELAIRLETVGGAGPTTPDPGTTQQLQEAI